MLIASECLPLLPLLSSSSVFPPKGLNKATFIETYYVTGTGSHSWQCTGWCQKILPPDCDLTEPKTLPWEEVFCTVTF